jgi:hypothetical protein
LNSAKKNLREKRDSSDLKQTPNLSVSPSHKLQTPVSSTSVTNIFNYKSATRLDKSVLTVEEIMKEDE